ncbi:MAG: glutamyl-tRNA reductase, partial [Oscillospiraceae bacterium]|nr:glutamyl-tRNA reductase [Oscillospiraceae bacterium]
MEFAVLGLSCRTAPLPLREQAAFTDGQALDFCRRLADEADCQCMVLSTCNRCEVYLVSEGAQALPAARAAYLARLPGGDNGCLFTLTGRAGLEHLFRVAAGLDSMVLGEDQILGQVQHALTLARAGGTAGKELGRLVQLAVTAAKRIKTELAISTHPLSLCYIGVQMLEREFGVKGRRALVLGSGAMAGLALEHLMAAGAAQLTVCCRTESHGRALAQRIPGLRVLPFSGRRAAAAECELIVGATASPHTVFRAEHLPG